MKFCHFNVPASLKEGNPCKNLKKSYSSQTATDWRKSVFEDSEGLLFRPGIADWSVSN